MKTSELLHSLLSQTDKKAETKLYNCFLRTISSLKNKELTDLQLQKIQKKLTSLNLNASPENRKKFYKQKLSEFKKFLKDEFSFTPDKYYTELGMVYGMSFGIAIGLSIGAAINPVIGTSTGLSVGIGVGMLLGMLYGTRKDSEAKRMGRLI